MFLRATRSLIFSIVTLALFALPTYAANIITYNTSNSWQTALSSFQTIDFSGLAPANSYTMYPGGFSVNGVQFVGLSTYALPIGVLDTASSSWYNFGTGDAAFVTTDRPNAGATVPYIHVILPAPVSGVAFNLFSASPSQLSFNVAVAGGQYTIPTLPLPTPTFVGFTSDTPFSSVDLTLQGTTYNGGTYAFVDNFSYGSVPETSTVVLIGVGLTVIGMLRRRTKRA